METHNCGSSREHGIAVASRAGTHKTFVIKRGGDPKEYVHKGDVPVL